MIQVPPQLSLDAGMEDEEELGRNVLDAATLGARASKIKIRTSIIRTRHAGAALVDEARERGSEVIYLDTVHAPSREHALGPTARYLLEKRPCRIIIETDSRLRTRRPGAAGVRASGVRGAELAADDGAPPGPSG